MADSPERIWASYRKQPEQLYAYPWPSEGQVEFQYIRADVARADAELAVAEALKRAADVGKMVGDGHYGDEVRAAILALAPADQAREMRPETTSEHIARDMREGRFPEQSERQMVPVLASLPDEIQVWRSTDTLDHIGTWATTRFPAEAVTYVPKADAQAAVALVVERAVKAANDEAEYQASVAKDQHASGIDWRATDWASRKLREVEAAILTLAPADALAEVQRLQARVTSLSEQVDTIAEQRDAALAWVEKQRRALVKAAMRLDWLAGHIHSNTTRDLAGEWADRARAALDEDARHG